MLRKTSLGLAALLLLPLPAAAQDDVLTWSARSSDRGKVHLRISHGRDGTANDWAAQELAGLDARFPAGAALSFRMAREAGTLNCIGTGSGGRGEGECRFVRNPAFFGALARHGVGGVDELHAWQLAIFDVRLALLDELRRQDYRTPSAGELIAAAIFKVDVEFLKETDAAGYRQKNLTDLVPFRIHKVDAAYVRGLKNANPRLEVSPKDLVQMRIHGVTPEWIAGWTQLGYNLSVREIVNTRIHGASPDYARAMLAEVRDRPTVQQFINMRIHGVRPGKVNK
jgi:hypothetical protein